jgi:hypothetical protein
MLLLYKCGQAGNFMDAEDNLSALCRMPNPITMTGRWCARASSQTHLSRPLLLRGALIA